MEEGGEFGEAEGEALGGGGAEGEVAEFAAGAWGFSVEVEVGVRDGEEESGRSPPHYKSPASEGGRY